MLPDTDKRTGITVDATRCPGVFEAEKGCYNPTLGKRLRAHHLQQAATEDVAAAGQAKAVWMMMSHGSTSRNTEGQEGVAH